MGLAHGSIPHPVNPIRTAECNEMNLMTLKDQVAVVTGGSRGIGKAIVEALAREGAKVAFVYKGSEEAARKLEADITAAGGLAKAYQGDVSDPAAAERIVEAVLADWGRVDILVNNAGVIRDKLFLQMEADDWNTVMSTNLGGAFAFCKAVAKPMAFKQRSGRIINISSVAAEHVNTGQANYAASKGALNSLTRVLAVELGRRNVLVNAVAPGFIETDMSQAVRNMAGEDNLKKLIPVRRLGKPEDIAAVVVFLAGPGAAYITGQVITVDGGLSLGAVSG
jgi:3-oxoacyl-[acyl-carrier protein] reductase